MNHRNSNLNPCKPSFLHKEMKEENLSSPKAYIQSTKRTSVTYNSLHCDSDIDYDSDGRWNVNTDCNPWITEKTLQAQVQHRIYLKDKTVFLECL